MTTQQRRHVINALCIGIGWVAGLLILTFGPGLGIPIKLAPVLAMVVWIGATWVFWGRGKEPQAPVKGPDAAG